MTGRTASVALFGYGNPSRGDDALGPLLLERAESWLGEHPNPAVTPISDFQLQIEHAEDLRSCDLALFLDADASCPPPFRFRRIQACKDASYTTHELSPESVLQVFERINGTAAPPSFILSMRGLDFDLGQPLSAAASGNLEVAWDLLKELLADPSEPRWDAKVSRDL